MFVLEHDVVDAIRTGNRAGLASGDVSAHHVLQLDGNMLGDMAEPRAFFHPQDQASRLAVAAAMSTQPREMLQKGPSEVRETVGRVLFKRPKVQLNAHHLGSAMEMWATIDPYFLHAKRLHRPQVGLVFQGVHESFLGFSRRPCRLS
jgi:hypothetical protein